MGYTYAGMIEAKGMLYAKRKSDGEELFAYAMKRDGSVMVTTPEGENIALTEGTFTMIRK